MYDENGLINSEIDEELESELDEIINEIYSKYGPKEYFVNDFIDYYLEDV